MKSWKKLLELERVVELEPPNTAEITQRIRLARLAVEESKTPGLRPGRSYQILYEAAYRWSEVVIRVEGWRTKGEGHHETLFSALPHFLGRNAVSVARFLDRCRRRRNVVVYGIEYPPVTDNQVSELANAVNELDSIIMSWLKSEHPELNLS
ncbi:MAG TPA: hypothetical protein ENN67_07705 [Firmicutes bacterium]|nr:hypothetical protein [Bacillota bacterium]